MKKWLLLLIGCAVVSFANSVSEKLAKDCNLNDSVACYNLGVLYYKGQEVEKNHKKALEFYTKACDLKYPSACNNLGILYEAKKDYKKALELYVKACDLENPNACGNLGTLYYTGQGVVKDYKKRLKFIAGRVI